MLVLDLRSFLVVDIVYDLDKGLWFRMLVVWLVSSVLAVVVFVVSTVHWRIWLWLNSLHMLSEVLVRGQCSLELGNGVG